MPFTESVVNAYSFSEVTESDRQALVTNNLGRTILPYELVYLDGYFGECREADGIANGETGYIKVDTERIIRTAQIETTDTFTAGNVMYFVPGGSSAAGKLTEAAGGTGVAIGTITGEGGTGGDQTYVEFRPYLQKADLANLDTRITTLEGEMDVEQAEPKVLVFKVTADATAGLAITGLSEGDEIIAASVICTAANASGTLKITDGTNDITDGIACSTDTAVDYAATIDDSNSVIGSGDTAKVVSVGGTTANTRGILVITYIPA